MRTELKRCIQSSTGAGIETRSHVDLQIKNSAGNPFRLGSSELYAFSGPRVSIATG